MRLNTGGLVLIPCDCLDYSQAVSKAVAVHKLRKGKKPKINKGYRWWPKPV